MRLYSVLSEHGLDKTDHLGERLSRLSPDELNTLIRSLEDMYRESSTPHADRILDPLVFCFPVLSPQDLEGISGHVMFATTVYLDDPLLDNLYVLADVAVRDESVYQVLKEKLIRDLSAYLSFYWRAKDAVQSGKLIPFKNLIWPFDEDVVEDVARFFFGDQRLRRRLGIKALPLVELGIWLQLRLSGKKAHDFQQSLHIADPHTLSSLAAIFIQITSLVFLQTLGGLQGLSTDLVSNNNYLLLRCVVQFLSEFNRCQSETNRAQWPIGFSRQHVDVPLLCGIPLERVLDLVMLEPDTFQAFKASLRQQLLSIDAPAGSIERDMQISTIIAKMEKDIADMTVLLHSAQKKLSQKFAVYSSLGVFSIIVAGLSSLGHNLDVVSVIGSITAGAGISTSLKEFAKEWLAYQGELTSLRSNPNYFLWKSRGIK